MTHDLIDLDTLVAVRKAAPQVTLVPFEVANGVVFGLKALSKLDLMHVDQNDATYWQATVKEIYEASHFEKEPNITISMVGRALKDMGLESWRKGDGFHVAWSKTQLEILKKFFKA